MNAFPEQAPLGWRGSRRWRLVARQIELSQQALPHRYNLQVQSRHGTNSHSCDINRSGVLFYLLFTVRYPSSLFRWFGIQCLRVFSHLGRFSPRRELRDQLKHTCARLKQPWNTLECTKPSKGGLGSVRSMSSQGVVHFNLFTVNTESSRRTGE